jgi:hypothetical protein
LKSELGRRGRAGKIKKTGEKGKEKRGEDCIQDLLWLQGHLNKGPWVPLGTIKEDPIARRGFLKNLGPL